MILSLITGGTFLEFELSIFREISSIIAISPVP